MTKCISCGHSRHDLQLNCPKCGSFYSKIFDDFSMDEVKVKTHFEQPKHRLIAIGTVIFLVIVVIFL